MVWRRLLVRSDSTMDDLHYTLQIAIDWSDTHLNRFHIHGKDFGVYHNGGMTFADDPEQSATFRFWIPDNLLLQMRTWVLNGELEQTFREWYPDFRSGTENLKKAA